MSRMGGMGGLGGMPDIGKLMKQAQKMQEDAAKLQEDLADLRISASAGGGMVTVTVNGHGHLTGIKIDPVVVDPADTELLEDLIITAAKEASERAVKEAEKRTEAITGGLKDMQLPPGLF